MQQSSHPHEKAAAHQSQPCHTQIDTVSASVICDVHSRSLDDGGGLMSAMITSGDRATVIPARNFVMYPHGTLPFTASHAATTIPALSVIDQTPNQAPEPTGIGRFFLFASDFISSDATHCRWLSFFC
jgi:hypothetical protein